ncbi:acetyl/propionyl/methylcrotonyl-CoA carboxylase subunit alpha [Pseudomonas zhanjiangensis]|uniref:Acetyl-CoA carboxylase biotin carboxylase subunit n=1 Tax=Pseudomonas zhanjiangensis TaxID=3239015 RepID=A0ABV3YWV0_9PSED
MAAFNKILIANRGEIACRVMRTAHALGYRTVAVYSEADADARHVQLADQAVCIGPAQVSQSYLAIERIIAAARLTDADAIHPGYGFLSENAEFARACEAAGIVFIGPSVEAIQLMGSKRLSKLAMQEAGVPCIPGYQGAAQDDETLTREAERIGYPLMIKASAGGGGRGMRLVHSVDDLAGQLRSARSEALNAFGSGELILERALLQPRHVEIQVFGDQHGQIVHLGERDCSVQRRHQKVVEEAPCPLMTAELRQAMGAAAVRAAATVNYVGAGTVEFLLEAGGAFYFLEMNTRLQVEHPVTELVTGQDLVAWQIQVAEGQPLPLGQEDIHLDGHAIEVRLYAEDPARDFLPQTGRVLRWEPAESPGVRIDHGLIEGQVIGSFYDPMLAKLIAHGRTREEARRKLLRAVEDCVLLGINANQHFLANLLGHPAFAAGQASTAFIDEHLRDDPSLAAKPPSAAELASAAALFYQASAQASAHQGALAGWRNAGNAPWQFLLQHGEQRFDVQLSVEQSGPQPRLAIRVSNQQIQLHLLASDGHWATLERDGVRLRLAYCQRDRQLWLYGRHGNLELSDVSHEPVSVGEGAGEGRVKAPMDGAIVEVLVTEGERVAKGQLLLVLEAMKMEHPLKARVDGVIRRVQVNQGDQVKNRQLLVEVTDE